MTMTRGKLWIITDEELIVQPVFYQEIPIGVSHNKGIIKFVELYQLGIKVDEDDYHKAPCTIAEMVI